MYKMNEIAQYYQKYYQKTNLFDSFHNDVINMPRDHFSTSKLKQLRYLSAYFLLLKNKLPEKGTTYKEILKRLIEEIKNGTYPKEHLRDIEFENQYLIIDIYFDKVYKDKIKEHPEHGGLGVGRMFRHLAEFASIFGLINNLSKNRKTINYDRCEQLIAVDEEAVIILLRNFFVFINVKNNSYFRITQSNGIIYDYRPTIAILNYIKAMGRSCTDFEISFLLGRLDSDFTHENLIFSRAIAVGKNLTERTEEQIREIFNSLGWHNNLTNEVMIYKTSQQPEFKFKVYLLCMKEFNLIEYDNKTISLTKYSEELLAKLVTPEIIDLENLLDSISSSKIDEEVIESIIRTEMQELKSKILESEDFIIKLNKYSLQIQSISNSKKKIRSNIISEAAKIISDYKDALGDVTFTDKKGRHYVESHHIIYFNGEDGPDITENLITLSPNNHTKIHRADDSEVVEMIIKLRSMNMINLDRFIKMVEIYNCLNVSHVESLHNKHIINSNEKIALLELIKKQPVNRKV